MNIQCKLLNLENNSHISDLLKWRNDQELYQLTNPQKSESFENKAFDLFKQELVERPIWANGIYLIFDGKKAIGTYSLMIDPGHLLNKDQKTSWLGLTIGERDYWGTGAAISAMEHFEKESRRRGAQRIELGTFAFNQRAQAFYKKLGYSEFARIPNFTYKDGKYWDDIRMEKTL